jgi:hypothetical protein
MIERLLRAAFRSIANLLESQYHENFDITSAALELHDEGVQMIASGFVYPTDNHPVGVYIIKYKSSLEENRYGRYN